MYIAKLTGEWPEDVKGYERIPGMNEPTETKEFMSEADAKAWLLGDGLHSFRWPVYSVEIFNAGGEQIWRAYHSSNQVLQNKNEIWWHNADPGRREREEANAQRRRDIEEGRVPWERLSDKEKFEIQNPLWLGPFFSWLPTRTYDAGWIWLRSYWIRRTLGIKCVNKGMFPDSY
jgi:hypothetical protein